MDRTIRVFISSTFKDMAAERDYLMKKVFPRLQKVASERNVSVLPLDLRWGITEAEAESGKVLEVCLREIDNSRPFFIGILGNRYGWSPSTKELLKNPYLREEYGAWLSHDIDRELSITEIEMQYGILRRDSLQHAYFYERTGGVRDPRVKHLRDQIETDGRYPLKSYSKPDELGDMIERDFIALLDKLYPKRDLSHRETEYMVHQGFRASLCESYFPDPAYLKTLDDFLAGDKREMVVYGESGMGKSALVANWLQNVPYSWRIIYHSVGLTGKPDMESVAEAIVEQITDERGMQVEEALRTVAAKGPLLLVLDGIDCLSEEKNAKRLMWLGDVPDGARFLFTTTDNDSTLEALRLRGASELRITPLDPERRKKMVTDYLAGFGKKLSPAQLDRIVSSDLAANTNVLKSLLDELLAFGVFKQLDSLIDYYLKARGTAEFFTRIIKRKEQDFGRRTVQQALSLTAFSFNGLSETEILDITGMNRLSLSQFLCSFQKHIYVRSGLINFRHAQLTKAVRDYYSGKETASREAIARHFASLPKDDRRTLEELPKQYFALGKANELYNYLSSILVFSKLYVSDIWLLGKYWRYLIRKGYKTDVYLNQEWVDDPSESDHYKMVVLNGIGFVLFRAAGDHSTARKYYEASLKVAGDTVDPYVARAWYDLARIHYEQKDFETSLKEANKAYSLYKQCGLEESSGAAYCFSVAGQYYSNYAQDYRTALNLHKMSLKLFMEHYGEYNNETIAAQCCVANDLCMLRRLDEAEEYVEKALKNGALAFGELHETAVAANSSKGLILYFTQHYEEAQSYLEKSLKIAENLFGPTHPLTVQVKIWIGYCYKATGKWEMAVKYFEALLKEELKAGVSGLWIIDHYLSICESYFNLGKQLKALSIGAKGAAYGEEFIEETTNNAVKALLLYKLGQLNYYAWQKDDAIPQFEECISIWEEMDVLPKELIGFAYNFIGLLHFRAGEKNEARDFFLKAHENLQDVNPSIDAIVVQNIKSTQS